MKHKGYNGNTLQEFNYKKFQGQELTAELGFNMYEFKYRMHDPATGRFMQIDPLAEDYVHNSTYAFAENRVIDGIELEGLEWKSIKDNDSEVTTLQLTVQLYNEAGVRDGKLENLKQDLQEAFKKSFSGEGFTGELIITDTDKAEGDYLVTLTEKTAEIFEVDGVEYRKYKGGKAGVAGETQKNSFDVTAKVDGGNRSNSSITRSFTHEAGHTGGLFHPWSKLNKVGDITQGAPGVTNKTVKENLMNTDDNPVESNRSHQGRNLTNEQLKSLDKLIREQQ